ncbi:MAG: metal-sensing transcriptional repressor [Candidatus Daviesbacteria bacterium]|nr:metal-sensing transcriptional repressor [Candidatus Daviesbacteria bacterium]
MYQPKDTQERILHRLKIAQGHLKKVLNMVENGEYCIDVIHQSKAVQRALQEADSLVLGNHLRTCASESIKKGDGEKAINELTELFQRK